MFTSSRRARGVRLTAAWAAASIAGAILVPAAACTRKETEISEYAPWTGSAPLTIRGVASGQDRSEVIALLGTPDRRAAPEYGPETFQWQRFGDMVVTLDTRSGRVTEVLGDRLTAGKDVVVEHGMSGADLRRILGKPASDRSHYRPSGSGIVSLGGKLDSRTLTYSRDGRTIEITLRDDRLAYVRLRPSRP